jgi:osmotically-inducible protein OsmY
MLGASRKDRQNGAAMKTRTEWPAWVRAARRSPTAGTLAGFVLLGVLAAPLAGCTGVAVGAGATVAAAAAEERGVVGSASDFTIMSNINAIWLKHNGDIVRHVDATVTEGRVLLTGLVPTQEMRLDAVRLVWRAPGVREVINEIKLSNQEGIGTYAQDSLISAQLVSRITFDSRIKSINYSVETVNGVVYVMGIAQNEAELERVRNHARQLPYVRRVVSYAVLKNDPRRRQ